MEAFCRNLNFESGIPVVNPTVYTNPLASPPISTPSSQVMYSRVPNRHLCILIVLQIIVDSIFLQNIMHKIKDVQNVFVKSIQKSSQIAPNVVPEVAPEAAPEIDPEVDPEINPELP